MSNQQPLPEAVTEFRIQKYQKQTLATRLLALPSLHLLGPLL